MAASLPQRVTKVASDGAPHLVFCSAPASDGAYSLTVVDIAKPLEDDFRAIAREAADSLRLNQAPVAYAATERPPESKYPVLDQTADEASWALLRPQLLAALAEASNYAVLPDADLSKARPLFYVIACHQDSDVVLFGRATEPRNVPKKSMRISAVFRDGVLHKLEEELVLFDSKIDWIFWKDAFYIINVPAFERVFIDRQRLIGQVTTNIAAVTQTLTVVGQADLATRCAGNLNMAVKLQRIISRGEYKKWSVAQLKSYSQKYQPAIQWQGDAVVFDGSLGHQWDILKMLDEAWFTAELSQEHFEATSKIEA